MSYFIVIANKVKLKPPNFLIMLRVLCEILRDIGQPKLLDWLRNAYAFDVFDPDFILTMSIVNNPIHLSVIVQEPTSHLPCSFDIHVRLDFGYSFRNRIAPSKVSILL